MPELATFNPPAIEIFVDRTVDRTWDLYQEDGETPLVISASDNVRFKLWDTDGVAPDLELDSKGPFSANFTADAGTDFLTSADHQLSNGDIVRVSTTTTLPAPLAAATDYYLVNKTANTFQLALTAGGAPIDITTAGVGTHTWTAHKSKVTVNNVGGPATTPAWITVRFHQWDTDGLTAGDYTGEASLVDDDDDDVIKPLFRCAVKVTGSATGDLGIT